MKFDLIPIQVKLIALLGVVTVVFLLGFQTASYIKNNEITKLKNDHLAALSAAQEIALTTEQKYRSLESRTTTALGAIADNYEQARQNEKVISDAVISNLRDDVVRLRVSTKSTPAPTGPRVPGTPASAGSCNGPTEQTLTGSVAARLAGRYADYNGLVDQLKACQAVITADRQMK